MDVKNTIKNYLDNSDWRVKENANTGYSFSGLSLRVSEDAFEEYMLDSVFTPEIKNSHQNCYIKLHDCGYPTVYCAGHDLRKILSEGLNGVKGKINTYPPKHLSSAINLIVNFFGIMQMEAAGAQAISNFDTLLAGFVKNDNMKYEEVKQQIQNLVWHLNIPNRWGAQCPFTNITIDIEVPKMFKDERPVIGGKVVDFKYSECKKEMDMINKALFEIMSEGDATGQPFTFPIVTVNLSKNFDWDSNISKEIFKATAKYGLPYFQNFINSDLNPEDCYSMCCRLRINKKELIKHTGGLFGSGASTGSIGVITLNLPKYAYEAKGDIRKFYLAVDKYLNIAKDAQEIKRLFIEEQLKKGLYPYFQRYLGTFKNHFSTIGLLGGNEACMNLLGTDIKSKEGKAFIIQLLNHIRKELVRFQKETGSLYNLEATPAESTAYKLAKFDKAQHPNIITSGTDKIPYYTNSTLIPADGETDILEAIKHQDDIQSLYSGGTVQHFYLGERLNNWQSCRNIVKKIAEKSHLPYFSITPTFSVCPVCKYVIGEHQFCPNEHSKEDLEKYGVEIQ